MEPLVVGDLQKLLQGRGKLLPHNLRSENDRDFIFGTATFTFAQFVLSRACARIAASCTWLESRMYLVRLSTKY